MFFYLLLSLFLGTIFSAYGNVEKKVRLRIINNGPEKLLKIGEPFRAEINIWPKEFVSKESILNLKGKNIQDNVLLIDYDRIGVSPNNEDVWVFNALLVYLDINLGSAQAIGNQKPIAEYKGLLFDDSKNLPDSNEFHVLSSSYDFEKPFSKIFGVVAILIISLIIVLMLKKDSFFSLSFFEKKRLKKEYEKKRAHWLEKFKNANNRESLEELFIERENWKSFVPGLKNESDLFLSVLYENQYKPKWDELIFESAVESKNKIQEGMQKEVQKIVKRGDK